MQTVKLLVTDSQTHELVPQQTILLTERELAVLKRAAVGQKDRVMAKALYLSPRTIRNCLDTLYHKFGVDNRIQLVVKAAKLGII